MKNLLDYINESEMIEINNTQTGLGRLLRKLLKAFLGDYENDIYNPSSDNFDHDETEKETESRRNDMKLHSKETVISDKSEITNYFKKEVQYFTYLSYDYEKNPKRYKNIKEILSLSADLEDVYKNSPYIIAPYSVEKKTIDFKCVEVFYHGEKEDATVKKFLEIMKKRAQQNSCDTMKINFVAFSNKKEDTSFNLMKDYLSKKLEYETSSENSMYYYTYTVKLKKEETGEDTKKEDTTEKK